MDAPATERRRGYAARQHATLAFAHVRPEGASALARATAWHDHLLRLGLPLPLFVVHDLGLLFTARAGTCSIGPRTAALEPLRLPPDARNLLARYGSLLSSVAESEVAQKAPAWRIKDELVAVVLARLLADPYERWDEPARAVGAAPLRGDESVLAPLDDAALARAAEGVDPRPPLAFLRLLVDGRLRLLTAVEQVDLGTLRLFGLLGGGGAVDLVDLYGALDAEDARDVVDFSLDLLPSVLLTPRASGVQSFAVDGYASIERKGSVDSLLLSEFAWDEELFERKLLDDELYYYGRERPREEPRRLAYLLVDSSPSMRGVRQVFARGLALALGKKLALAGVEVWLRFFDSRLYDLVRLDRGDAALPYLLSFKSERGRNYDRVFRQLLVELTRLSREDGRRVLVYLVTHGQCHVEPELVEKVAREAQVHGVFILPSQALRLEYLPSLSGVQVVDAAQLASRERRKRRALDILGGANEAATRVDARPDAASPARTR